MNTSSESTTATTSSTASNSSTTTTPANYHGHQLPPISELFSQSWQRFTGGVLNALFLTLLSGVTSLILFIFAVVLFISITASKLPIGEMRDLITQDGPVAVITELGPTFGIAVGVSVVVLIIASILVGSVFNGAMVYAFAWSDNKPGLGDIFSAALRKAGVFILLSLLLGLLSFGAFWVFMLPTVVLAIFFGFAMYELLLENKGPIAALKSSVAIVTSNFGPLAGRWLLFILGYLLVVVVLPASFEAMGETIGGIYGIFNLFISYAVGWYSVAFITTLYMHAKAATPEKAANNGLYWGLVSISLVGWVICFIFAGILFSVVASKAENWQEIFNQNKSSMNENADLESISDLRDATASLDTITTSCDVAIGRPDTYSDEANSRFWIYEERTVEPSVFKGFVPDKQIMAGVQAGYLSFKSNDDRLSNKEGATYNLDFPGYRLYCVPNTAKLDLTKFVEQAQASKNYTVTLTDSQRSIGDLLVQPISVQGLTNGDYYKENLYLGVTPADDSHLVILMPVGPDSSDAMYTEILTDIWSIENSIKTELTPVPGLGKVQ